MLTLWILFCHMTEKRDMLFTFYAAGVINTITSPKLQIEAEYGSFQKEVWQGIAHFQSFRR